MAAEDQKIGGKFMFDLFKSGTCLLSIAFGSRSCTDMECRYHSFVGEKACGC